jgi:hypothetical protein
MRVLYYILSKQLHKGVIMTRFIETAERTVSKVENSNAGWIVTFMDGTCRLVTRAQIRGNSPIEPGKILESCRNRCNGPTEDGECSIRPKGRPKPYETYTECHEQFVYAKMPRHFHETLRPKLQIMQKKLARRIKGIKVIKQGIGHPLQYTFEYENGEQQTLLKSQILGHNSKNIAKDKEAFIGFQIIPCREECKHDGPTCNRNCIKPGTLCNEQFFFCRRFSGRHK